MTRDFQVILHPEEASFLENVATKSNACKEDDQNCRNTSDLIPLYLPLELYLKPIARLNMSVQLPNLKKLGKSISHLEIMDKLRELIKPDEFKLLKVTKTTIQFVRFEGEVETRAKLKSVISKTDNKLIQLKDFSDLLRIRVAEWKSDFPNRNSWDNFFQNSRDMDEMKPGERPDTIYFSNLPTKWFLSQHSEDVIPSEKNLYRIFEKFGTIRYIDVPVCDPYRKKMKNHISGFKNSSINSDYFECYVQFKDYIGFNRTMDAFRNMKLVHKKDGSAVEVDINIDFDKSKHLSDASIRRREIVRDRLIKKTKEKEEKERAEFEERKQKEEIERQRELDLKQQKELRRKLREEKRKVRILQKLEVNGTDEINEKIAKEEKKLLKVQRKLEAIRLVEELFKRITDIRDFKYCDTPENDELKKFKCASELEVLNQRERLHHAVKGRAVLKNILAEQKKRKYSTTSDSSVSLNEFDMKTKTTLQKYPLYDPRWFGFRYHFPPESILPHCTELTPIRFFSKPMTFPKFPGSVGSSRGIFHRRGNSQRRFRGSYYGRYFQPEVKEQSKAYSSCYRSRRTRSRSNSSYSRSCSRSPPNKRSNKKRSRSQSSLESRTKSQNTSRRSNSKGSSRNKVSSKSSKKTETKKKTQSSQSKSEERKSRSKERYPRTSSDKSVDSSTFMSPKQFSQNRYERSRSKSWSLPRK